MGKEPLTIYNTDKVCLKTEIRLGKCVTPVEIYVDLRGVPKRERELIITVAQQQYRGVVVHDSTQQPAPSAPAAPPKKWWQRLFAK